VTYDGQKIVLQGVVHNKNEYRVVEETAVSMSEGRPLRIELHGRG